MLSSIVFAALLAACECPNERDQLQIAATIEDWPAAGLDCSGGCGYELIVTMMPENEGSPHDTEGILVSFPVADGTPTVELAYAWDTDLYSFPESFDKASFSMVITNSVAASAALGPVEAEPSSVAPPETKEVTGEECNIEEEIKFEISFDGATATHFGGDTGADSGA